VVSVWPNSSWTFWPFRNWRSSMRRMSMSRRMSLKESVVLFRMAERKRYMKCSAVR